MQTIPYPDMTRMPDELAQAVARMVRLVGQMRDRFPDLDRFAIATDTEIDRAAAEIVAKHVERLHLGFEVFLSPFDPVALPHAGPLPYGCNGAAGSGGDRS